MRVKTERYASMFLKEINNILYSEIRDLDIVGTTATCVKLSDDMSYARIYCTVFDITKKDKAIKDLNNAKGYIKTMLCKKKLPLRKLPEIDFVYDESLSYGEEMDKLIDKTNKNKD
jgi:ribosome-binding factor A